MLLTSMRRISLLTLVFILFGVLSAWNMKLRAQFQIEWLHYEVFGTGNIVNCEPDNAGGLYVGVQTLDTMCNYDLGVITHLNTTGNPIWSNAIYYESPCITQRLYSLLEANGKLFYSVQDTSGWIIKGDSTGNEIWKIDTGYTFVAKTIDNSGRITAYVPQWSEVFCTDTNGLLLWTYSLPYTFQTDIRDIVNDNNQNRIVTFDFIDPSQSDNRGVGVIKLNSFGQLQWDTLINSGTSPDEDYFVDVVTDNFGCVYVATRDISMFQSFITKLDASGNIMTTAEFTPVPAFQPTQIELDTTHGLVYVAGRSQDSLIIVKYDLQLNPLDTMYFDRIVPDVHVIAVNEYGYLFHLWMSDSNSIFNLRLEMYDHLGQIQSVFTYFDTAVYYVLYPKGIYCDSNGGIFVACNGKDLNLDDVELVIKLSNPLDLSEPTAPPAPISVHPNPCNDFVDIDFPPYVDFLQYAIYSSDGRKASEGYCSRQQPQVETTSLLNGIYFLELTSDESQYTQKLIIQH